MALPERAIMFHVRMSDEERRMLEELAASEGVSASDFVRLVIRRRHADRFGLREPPSKASKKGSVDSVRRWVVEAKSKDGKRGDGR
jgi:hypothetical protein